MKDKIKEILVIIVGGIVFTLVYATLIIVFMDMAYR